MYKTSFGKFKHIKKTVAYTKYHCEVQLVEGRIPENHTEFGELATQIDGMYPPFGFTYKANNDIISITVYTD